jgi:hypothetical protein
MCFGFTHRPLTIIALGAALSFSSVALAQEMPRPVEDRGSRGSHDRSLSDAVRHVQRTTGGRILGAERVPYDGRDINRVKYMDDRGRVRYMDAPVNNPRVDPASVPRHSNH